MKRPKVKVGTLIGLVMLLLMAALLGAWLWRVGTHLSPGELGSLLRETYAWVQQHWTPAMGLFVGLNVLVALIGVPLSPLLYVMGGYVFGPWVAAALAVVGGTLGCGLVFRLARNSRLRRHARKVNPQAMRKAEAMMKDGGWEPLLAVRLFPGIPFPAINLGAALLNVPLWRFVWTTFVGITPSILLMTLAGEGLDRVVTRHGLELSSLMTPAMMMVLAGFAMLTLLPLGVRWGLKWWDKTGGMARA